VFTGVKITSRINNMGEKYMAIKQMKLTVQAVGHTESGAELLVLIDGNVMIDQSVPSVGSADLGIADPSEIVEFDIEVGSAQGQSNLANILAQETRSFSATATNGVIKLENISVNFNPKITSNVGNILANVVSSGADGFFVVNIVTQPLWDGVADTAKYDIKLNNGPEQITGPGEVLIQAGETVTFDISVPLFYD
jgi:hypothetical protein